MILFKKYVAMLRLFFVIKKKQDLIRTLFRVFKKKTSYVCIFFFLKIVFESLDFFSGDQQIEAVIDISRNFRWVCIRDVS